MSIITQIHDSQNNKFRHFIKNTDATSFLVTPRKSLLEPFIHGSLKIN